MWELQWGSDLKLYESLQNSGSASPLDYRIQVLPHLSYFYVAFCVLHKCRTNGFNGPNPIPMTELLAYCKMKYIDDVETREDYIYYVSALDETYIDWYRKHQKNK